MVMAWPSYEGDERWKKEPNLLVVGELKARGVAFKAGLLGVLAAGCIKGYTAAARCMCGVLAAWWCCSYMGI
ncbi:hypothetical protein V6N13_004742 [Hibiscus sabdariffa]